MLFILGLIIIIMAPQLAIGMHNESNDDTIIELTHTPIKNYGTIQPTFLCQSREILDDAKQMKIIANTVLPEHYKKVLKQYNVLPEALASVQSFLLDNQYPTEPWTKDYFHNIRQYNQKNYDELTIALLNALHKKNNHTTLDRLSRETIGIITKQRKESVMHCAEQEKMLKTRVIITYGGSIIAFTFLIIDIILLVNPNR